MKSPTSKALLCRDLDIKIVQLAANVDHFSVVDAALVS